MAAEISHEGAEQPGVPAGKNNEKLSSPKLVYFSAQDLVRSQPKKFAVRATENDWYLEIVACTHLTTEEGAQYDISLSIKRDMTTGEREESILIINPDRNEPIYRLDITYGARAKEELEKMQEIMMRNPEGELTSLLRQFVSTYFDTSGETPALFSDCRLETVVGTDEARRILRSARKLEIPPRMAHYPRLDEFLEKVRKSKGEPSHPLLTGGEEV